MDIYGVVVKILGLIEMELRVLDQQCDCECNQDYFEYFVDVECVIFQFVEYDFYVDMIVNVLIICDIGKSEYGYGLFGNVDEVWDWCIQDQVVKDLGDGEKYQI